MIGNVIMRFDKQLQNKINGNKHVELGKQSIGTYGAHWNGHEAC